MFVVKRILLIAAAVVAVIVLIAIVQRGGGGAQNAAASPDVGGKIAFAAKGSIWMYTGGKAQKLTKGPADRADKRDGQPSFSPDGTQIVYARFDEGFSDLYKLNVSNPTE